MTFPVHIQGAPSPASAAEDGRSDRGREPWTDGFRSRRRAKDRDWAEASALDDRSLTRVGSWSAGTGSAYYRSTYLRSYSYGAKLVRSGVVARRIAIVATTCPSCGSVKVYWGSTLLRTIRLTSTTTVNRRLISVTTFTSARRGTLTIKVSSSSRKVVIDGIAIRRN
jgi:hypothetical protein